jgi:hypothetical protein
MTRDSELSFDALHIEDSNVPMGSMRMKIRITTIGGQSKDQVELPTVQGTSGHTQGERL